MGWRIKSWEKFQHFKDRTPPWIKLYRDILDDPDWHELDADSAKVLISLWLIASEDDTHKGLLPETRRLAFRLRIKESQVIQHLNKLSHWLIQDDISVISDGYQVDAPETEERQSKRQRQNAPAELDVLFGEFWLAYPKKVGKDAALKAFGKRTPDRSLLDAMLEAIRVQSQSEQWQKDGGQFIPNPATWLNQGRWMDGDSAELSPAERLRRMAI